MTERDFEQQLRAGGRVAKRGQRRQRGANGLPAAVNVGVRPTFETGRGLLMEAHVIDRDADLYGQILRVAFIARLRGERRFPGAEDLIAQMHRDVAEARDLCATFSPP